MKLFRQTLLLVLPLLLGSASTPAAERPPDVLVPEILHSFSSGISAFDTGAVGNPNGNYYGVTNSGGDFGKGTFFEFEPGSSNPLTILTEFGDPDSEARGIGPIGPLVRDAAGRYYGVTTSGGRNGYGTVFRVATDGTVLTLVDFSGPVGAAPGAYPRTGLAFGADGNLYGTTSGDSHTGYKANLFRVSPTSGSYEPLLQFTGKAGAFPGDFPSAPLVRLVDDAFIGVTQVGGAANSGIIFRFDPINGGGYKKVASFDTADTATTVKGRSPFGTLVVDASSNVYGLARGNAGATNIWQVPLDGAAKTFTEVVRVGSAGPSLSNPGGGLALLENGDLLLSFTFDSQQQKGGIYSVNAGTGAVAEVAAFDPAITNSFSAFGLNTDGGGGFLGTQRGRLYHYNNGTFEYLSAGDADRGTGEGANPDAPVVFGTNGTLYGHCAFGGDFQAGTIFQYPTTGSLSPLTSIDPAIVGSTLNRLNLTPTPSGDLLFIGPDGGNGKLGAIYKADSSGIVTAVSTFTSGAPNNFAQDPNGSLLPDGSGNYYGVAGSTNGTDVGVVFQLSATNTLSSAGGIPRFNTPASEFLGIDGFLAFNAAKTSLLGVVENFSGGSKRGYLFQLPLGGTATQLLDFDSSANRLVTGRPQAPLQPEPSSGGFIFTTTGSSDKPGRDQLVRLTSTNTLEQLFKFDTTNFDFSPTGALPVPPLALEPSTGTIFGVTQYGGDAGTGVIYRRKANGDFLPLHRFHSGTDEAVGESPSAGLTRGSDGYIYGTTRLGGPLGGGTLFRFSPTPNPVVGGNLPPIVTASVAIVASALSNNGYAGEYWVQYGENPGNLDQARVHTSFAGFTGTDTATAVLTELKGHTTYHYQLHVKAGPDSDAVTATGAIGSFTTPNGAPIAQNDNILSDSPDGPFIGQVTVNDKDPDGDEISLISASDGSNGTVQIDGNTVIYTPGPGFTGTDSFTYTVQDDQPIPLTATATVFVRASEKTVGDYAGLLVDAAGAPGTPPEAAIGPIDRLIAGLAQMSITRGRNLTGRFTVGKKTVAVKAKLAVDRDTLLRGAGNFSGSLRIVPSATEARITYNGRTLVLRAGQAFSADANVPPPPKSDFTMRFIPQTMANPVNSPGLPAGAATAIIRQSTKGRCTLLGTLPDGTKFSRSSVIDTDRHLPFQATLYKDKTGSLDGELVLATTGEITAAPTTTIRWIKTAAPKDKRFAEGFSTRMNVVGFKFEVGKTVPPLGVSSGTLQATFARGGLFAPISSRFTLNMAKTPVIIGDNAAQASLKLNARTGLVTGSFKVGKKATKYNGVIVQNDHSVHGFFLGTADTGSVQVNLEP